MSDQTVVHIGENSPEQIAHKLYREIAVSDGYYEATTQYNRPSRDYIIRTYAQCLYCVSHPGASDKAVEMGKGIS